MELIGRFQNQISPGIKDALSDVLSLRGALGDLSSQLDILGKTPKISFGAATPSAAPSRGSAGRAAPDKEAKERAAAEKYVAGIRDRYFASEQKRQEKEEKDAAKAEEKKAKDAQKAEEKKRKERDKTAKPASGGGLDASSKLLAAAKFAAVGFGASYVGQLALGYQGMARLQGITAKAQLNLRGLFKGVNPKPFLDTFERVSQLLSTQTSTGKALQGIFTRTFNGLFGGVKSNENLITGFLKGIVIGALRLENVWLRARIALFPLTNAVGKFFNQIGVGSSLGQIAFGLMTLRALKLLPILSKIAGFSAKMGWGLLSKIAGGGAAPVAEATGAAATGAATTGGGALGGGGAVAGGLGLAGAAVVGAGLVIGAVALVKGAQADLDKAAAERTATAAVAEQILDKDRQLINNALRSAGINVSETAGLGAGVAGRMTGDAASRDAVTGEILKNGTSGPIMQVSSELQEKLSASGKSAGAALGDGLVVGMKSKEGLVILGAGSLGTAADKGIRTTTETHSPSRMMARVGADMALGVVMGMREEAGAVQSAAEEALVPNLSGSPRGSAGGGKASTPTIGSLTVIAPNYLGDKYELAGIIRDEIVRTIRDDARMSGIDPGGTP